MEMTLEKNISNTVQQNSTSDQKMWESAIPPALQFGFGVIGNIIALVVLVTSSKKHKWRPFYRLVGGLAMTDGGGILLVYPTVMVRYATDFTYVFPKELCNYSSFVYTFTLISSAMIVCAMSLDRFVAILYPFTYNSDKNGRRANIMLGIIWSVGALVAGLQLVGLGSSFNYYPKSWCFINFVEMDMLDRINSYIYSVFGFLILLVTISVNTVVIVSVVRNMKSDIRSSKRRQKNDIFIVSFLLVIVIVFSSCWAPLISIIFAHACHLMNSNGSVELLVLRLAVTNSIVDPWIYILLRKETVLGLLRIKAVIFNCCVAHNSSENNRVEQPKEKYTKDLSTLPDVATKSTYIDCIVYDGDESSDPEKRFSRRETDNSVFTVEHI
ncbi:prostaglandin E2 receptor EP4 subtype-like [Saccostrea echinata]|uniref:prostaglandin E2 receptor EP4 subtype-like n=1 Tax=Saccostrea echinata TaxID=191078 RepID=UPI002A80FB18|nr:prostaglandin E2 receptor EP4 subtype-like [Saccostrea echinata]